MPNLTHSAPTAPVFCTTCRDAGGGYVTVTPGPWDGDVAYDWEDCPDCPQGPASNMSTDKPTSLQEEPS